jgi:hypothetical protein
MNAPEYAGEEYMLITYLSFAMGIVNIRRATVEIIAS